MAERERTREAAPKLPAKEPEPAKAEAPKRPNPFNWKGTQEEYDAAMEVYEKHQREQDSRGVPAERGAKGESGTDEGGT